MVHARIDAGGEIQDRRPVGCAAGLWDVGMVGYRGSALVQVLVAWQGQELDELVVGGDTSEELCGLAELVLLPALGADYIVLDLLQFLVEDLPEEVDRHLSAVVQDAFGM